MVQPMKNVKSKIDCLMTKCINSSSEECTRSLILLSLCHLNYLYVNWNTMTMLLKCMDSSISGSVGSMIRFSDKFFIGSIKITRILTCINKTVQCDDWHCTLESHKS